MGKEQQGIRWRWASIKMALVAITLLLMMPTPASPQQSPAAAAATATEEGRAMQESTTSSTTDFLTTNSQKTIQAMERHIFSPPIRKEIEKLFDSRIEYDGKVHKFPSYKYTFPGFWRNWKRMMMDGIPTGGTSGVGGSGGIGGQGKFVLFAGDEEDRYMDIIRDPRNPRGEKRQIKLFGYEYGLVNMAAFLSQAMVDGIYDDSCDELNEQEMYDRNGRPTNIFPQSNACGQYNASYQDITCPPDEKYMECPQMPADTTIPPHVDADRFGFRCGPTSVYPSIRNHPNDLERTDVENCCWWGRGPLNTKGVCSMGKINHYIGKKAYDEGRINLSTLGVFPDTDFCANPETICKTHDEDLLWSVAMFEWAERIQQYHNETSSTTWDYKEKLIEFVNGGMNSFEYYSEEVDTDRDYAFIHAVSSIVNRGCHNAPHCQFYGAVNKLPLRRIAFTLALSALSIPTIRTELVVEQALDHLKSRKEQFEANLLLSYRDDVISSSQRYKFNDFYNAVYRFSRPYVTTNTSYPANVTFFYSEDHDPLYMGEPYMKHGHKYGLTNIALLFANGLDLSIEKDDTCDELNEHDVHGKLPISNSCGQRGLSYQDMSCADDPNMACPVDNNMFITAVTGARDFGAPPPLQCGPKSRIPYTGYWDTDEMYEVDQQAYANMNARVDLEASLCKHERSGEEGCCWWGRGILQSKGTCTFGRLNYYLGKRAADEGRQSLFPDVDFCSNPEAVCGSQYKHELVWMTGIWEWVDRVQTYDQGGFNYMEELLVFSDGGMRDPEFIKKVGAIVQSGCHNPPCKSAGCLNFPCDGAYPHNNDAIVTYAYRTFAQLDLWSLFPISLGGSNAPSPAPTQCQFNCTEVPSESPFPPTASPSKAPVVIPTTLPSESPTRLIDSRLSKFEDMRRYLNQRRDEIESQIFVSESDSGFVKSKLYTFDGFLDSLRALATEAVGVNKMLFYIGQDDNFDMGLVNIALFLAHAMTRGILWDTCEEVNHQLSSDGVLPLSNACGQYGRTYTDDICPLTDAAMECAVDRSMTVEQVSVGNSGSPGFFCGPTSTYQFTGYYDPLLGTVVSNRPSANEAGRTDVAGCCFWGRGILLNQGVCDIGRFNHIYGLPAIMDERSGRYNIDFCTNPEAICSDFTIKATEFNKFPTTVDTSEARYLVGMLYWMHHVQSYNWGYWNYMETMKLFVKGGMKDDSFVDRFSEIVLDSTRDAATRKTNFKKVLEILFTEIETPSPTPPPKTPRPTRISWTSPGSGPAQTPWDGSRTGSPVIPASYGQGSATGSISNTYPQIPAGNSSDLNPQNVTTSNTNQKPPPTSTPGRPPNRPVSFDLSAPKPSASLPSVNIVDFDEIKNNSILSLSALVWTVLFVFSCTTLLLFFI